MLSKLTSKCKVVGTKQVKRAIHSNEIETVYIARDAEHRIQDEIAQICEEKQIQVIYVDNMKELGEACGIDVNAATAALIK